MAHLTLRDVTKVYGTTPVIHGVDVDIVFHEPVPAGAFGSRKSLAKALHATIADELEHRVRGLNAGVAAGKLELVPLN